jgi:hypothetical protein
MTLGHMVQGLLARGHRVSLVRPRQGPPMSMAFRMPGHGLATTTLVRGLPIPGLRRPQVRPAGAAAAAPQCGARSARRGPGRRPKGPLGASAVAAARELDIPVVTEFHTNFHAYSRHYGFGWLRTHGRRCTCATCTTAAT